MADEKTQTVHARLVKGFGSHQHRRAGYLFTPGPEYQELTVTEEGLNALKEDPSIEVSSASEARRINEQYAPSRKLTPEQEGSTDALQDPANVAGEKDTGATHARRYADVDPTRSDSPEAGFNAPRPPQESTEGDEAKADDVLLTLSRNDLNKTAIQEGVDSPEKLSNKQEVVEAIMEARKADTAPETSNPSPSDAGQPTPEDNGTDKAPAADAVNTETNPTPATSSTSTPTPNAPTPTSKTVPVKTVTASDTSGR